MKPLIGIVSKNITIEEFYNWSWQRISNDVRYSVNKNAQNEMGVGASPSFPVPNKYVESIKTETLGVVMDRIFNESDLRSTTGGIGLLTKDVVTRIDLTEDAFLMALTPFINTMWKDSNNDLVKE